MSAPDVIRSAAEVDSALDDLVDLLVDLLVEEAAAAEWAAEQVAATPQRKSRQTTNGNRH